MKLPLVALALHDSAAGIIDLNTQLSWQPSDIKGHSPYTSSDPNRAATLHELCEAAGRHSDNTATNLIIDAAGGLPRLNDFARMMGDSTTRFDRYELDMNVRDGDLDTTTASAFGNQVLRICRSLDAPTLTTLLSWLPGRDGRRTALAVPRQLDLRHKTGTSGDGAVNDVAILIANGDIVGVLAIFTDSNNSSEELVVEIARRAYEGLIADG